jgi:hypothetical protein
MFDSFWDAPPIKTEERPGCLRIVGRAYSSAQASALMEGDVYVAEDGSRWRAIHGLLDDIMAGSAPRRTRRDGWLCNH